MDRDTLLQRLNGIKEMPGLEFARKPGSAETPEQREQEQDVYTALNGFVEDVTNLIPQGYEFTPEDHANVKEYFSAGSDTDAVINKGGKVVEAIALMRSALAAYAMPINGLRCPAWSGFVERLKPVLSEA